MLTTLLLMAFGYLVCGLPTAYLLGRRLRGVDIRTVGSRNVGAINAYKQLGRRAGTVVLIVDAGKGAAVMLAARALGVDGWGLFAVAVAAIAGNNWSPYLRFSGGKGLAAAFGVSLTLLPLPTLAALPVAAVGYGATRGLVWALGMGMVAMNIMVALLDYPGPLLATCVVLSGIVCVTHVTRSLPEIRSAIRRRDSGLSGRVE